MRSVQDLHPGDAFAGKTVRSVFALYPYDVLAGSVTITFREGGINRFPWNHEYEENV